MGLFSSNKKTVSLSKKNFGIIGLINGPNLNHLGISRNPHLYGSITLKDIINRLTQIAKDNYYDLSSFQSNSQGKIIDFIQNNHHLNGFIINPGALMISGFSLGDAIVDSDTPFIEVHLTQIYAREQKRTYSVISPYCIGQICGFKDYSYDLALKALINHLNHQNCN